MKLRDALLHSGGPMFPILPGLVRILLRCGITGLGAQRQGHPSIRQILHGLAARVGVAQREGVAIQLAPLRRWLLFVIPPATLPFRVAVILLHGRYGILHVDHLDDVFEDRRIRRLARPDLVSADRITRIARVSSSFFSSSTRLWARKASGSVSPVRAKAARMSFSGNPRNFSARICSSRSRSRSV
jgi:hypothetical protein